jgi:hypothetical protein
MEPPDAGGVLAIYEAGRDTGGALDAAAAERLARIFKALGDPTRARLLSLIAAPTAAKPASATSPGPSPCPSRPSPTT